MHALASATALAVAASSTGCGFAAARLLRSTEVTRSTHPLLENDAKVLCRQTPCDAVPIVFREDVGWRAPLFFGSLLDLSVGGALLGRDGTPYRVGGYTLLVVGGIELLAQLIEAFPQPSLDGPATVLWRGRRIDLVQSDLAGQDLRDSFPISVAKIVEHRERAAPSQSSGR
jgi:hypothetical protein